jgi:hypothetical protein
MTEYELIDILVHHTDTAVSLLQWWAGITLGILVGVHVIGKDLNGYITSLLIILYIAFTALISVMSSAHAERQQLLIRDLEQLQEQGITVSIFTQNAIESGGPPSHVAILGAIGFWGLFLCAIGYVTYCYRKAKQTD